MDRKDFLERIRAAEKSRAGNALPAFDDSETVSFATLGDGTAREIIERNFYANQGEIDIIATKKGVIYFIEVKTRTSNAYGHPLESILTNKKDENRKGKVQLIDATSFKYPLRKNLGEKNCEITPEIRNQILDLYIAFDNADERYSKVFDNSEFGYWSVTVERPLRQKVVINQETIRHTLQSLKLSGIDFKEDDNIPVVAPSDFLQFAQEHPDVKEIKMPKSWGAIKAKEYCGYFMNVLIDLMDESPYMDMAKFIERFNSHELMKKHKLSFKTFERFTYEIIFTDPEAEIVYKNGVCVPDPQLRDSEVIPFTYDGGMEEFLENEIKPYAPDAYLKKKSIKIGYELSFTKYFYQPLQLRSLDEIAADIRAIEAETDGLLDEIIGG